MWIEIKIKVNIQQSKWRYRNILETRQRNLIVKTFDCGADGKSSDPEYPSMQAEQNWERKHYMW